MKRILLRMRNFGPGALVTAAFIGPGTVTMCLMSGLNYGTSLLWALVLSVACTVVLQEMAARVGIVTQKDLGQLMRENLNKPWQRIPVLALVFCAIVFGNTAYEAGNLSGAALGIQLLSNVSAPLMFPGITALLAALLLYTASFKRMERWLIGLVMVMSLSFLIAALLNLPELATVFSGLIPDFRTADVLMVAALVGTTVVPYNLFLHAALAREKWSGADALSDGRTDAVIAIALGGLISVSVMITAAPFQGQGIGDLSGLISAMEPRFGPFPRILLGFGLMGAGLTSAITAPLAAAYVGASLFGWPADLKDLRFRVIWMSVLCLGWLIQLSGYQPLRLIQLAQVANGALLPLAALLLWWLVNKSRLMGRFVNSGFQNIVTFIIVLLAFGLGLRSVMKAFGF